MARALSDAAFGRWTRISNQVSALWYRDKRDEAIKVLQAAIDVERNNTVKTRMEQRLERLQNGFYR